MCVRALYCYLYPRTQFREVADEIETSARDTNHLVVLIQLGAYYKWIKQFFMYVKKVFSYEFRVSALSAT